MAKSVKGTKTEICLKDAFAGESKANRRYLYFANMADIAGAGRRGSSIPLHSRR
jgi:hypothetical protein